MKTVILYDRHMPEEPELCFSSLGIGEGVKTFWQRRGERWLSHVSLEQAAWEILFPKGVAENISDSIVKGNGQNSQSVLQLCEDLTECRGLPNKI